MAKTDISAKKCVTHEFRVSFPAIFKPKGFQDQEPKYSVAMLFPKNVKLSAPANKQKNSLRAICSAAAAEKWGEDKDKWPKRLKMPFRDGDESETDGYAGHIYCNASSKTKPGVVDKDLTPIMNEADLYAGCYARAEVIAFAYDVSGNRGVGLALQNIQKLRDGQPFTGRKKPEDVFESVEDSDEEYEDDETDDGMGF